MSGYTIWHYLTAGATIGCGLAGVGFLTTVDFGNLPFQDSLVKQSSVIESEDRTSASNSVKIANISNQQNDDVDVGLDVSSIPTQEQKLVNGADDQNIAQGDKRTLVAPSFDLLRVEGDGSVVIAGHSAPDSVVDLIAGTKNLGSVKASSRGDFVLILDVPLRPGDYQLVLRSTEIDGTAATSLQTAVVGVPKKKDGEVLALVEEPGQASRLISKPTLPSFDNAKALSIDDGSFDNTRDKDVAMLDIGNVGSVQIEQQKREPESSLQALELERDVMVQANGNKSDIGSSNGASNQQRELSLDVPVVQNERSVQVTAIDENLQTIDGMKKVPVTSPLALSNAQPNIFVEAVEIEGPNIFVAGGGQAGLRVRVYANKILLGESKVSEGGRFLVETRKALDVGDYIIRADLLNASSAKVVARAAVPFEREAGERVAAVAPSVARGPNLQNGGKQPEETHLSKRKAIGFEDSVGTDLNVKGEMVALSSEGAKTYQNTDEQDQIVKPEVLVQTPKETAQLLVSRGNEHSDVKAVQPATASNVNAQLDSEVTASNASENVKSSDVAQIETNKSEVDVAPDGVTLAPKLKSTAGSVIIRRGDSLWRISRRVYGRGIRFTTIYLANSQQILDPDRIWPGQIFQVPRKTEDGEEADLTDLGAQNVIRSDAIAPKQAQTVTHENNVGLQPR